MSARPPLSRRELAVTVMAAVLSGALVGALVTHVAVRAFGP